MLINSMADVEPLLNTGLITRRLTKPNPHEVTVYYKNDRSYVTDINNFGYSGCAATVLLKDDAGAFLNASNVQSLTKNVRLKKTGDLVDVLGVVKAGLVKCTALVAGKWVYFDLRFV